MSLPETIYHYCSLGTFLNITGNRTLWLSDIGKSNDSQELKWLKNECRIRIMKAQNEYLNLHRDDPDITYDYDAMERINRFAEAISTIDLYKSWAICFSEARDTLSQWRGYANDGAGICIGFKREYFDELSHVFDDYETRFLLSMRKVDYSSEGLDAFFENTTSLNSFDQSKTTDDMNSALLSAIISTAKNAAYFKSPSFSEEREWRLAFTDTLLDFGGFEFDKMPRTESGVFSRFVFRKADCIATGNDIISHIELWLPEIQDAISEIIIGPKVRMSLDDMKLYLILKGFLKNMNDNSISIVRSESSYR